MARKQTVADLAYRLRRRLVRALRSRRRGDHYQASARINKAAQEFRELSIYARFLDGNSIEHIANGERDVMTRAQVEDVIRRRGGVV